MVKPFLLGNLVAEDATGVVVLIRDDARGTWDFCSFRPAILTSLAVACKSLGRRHVPSEGKICFDRCLLTDFVHLADMVRARCSGS